MKIFRLFTEHGMLILTIFLLAFIPLYPKLPLLDIDRTWVYIRVEDFLVAFSWVIFAFFLYRKKATLKTPLTIPIIIFWLVGAVATIHGVIFFFPHMQGMFPHIALLHFLRRIEYLSLFFIAYSAMKNVTTVEMRRRYLNLVILTLVLTLLAVSIYGIGQRYLGFPAFLTMNEEFAKGIPLKLSALSRISSTFAGHYDLAAYLGIFIPLMAALIFAYKKWWIKLTFFLATVGGLIVLLMTASRVGFGVYLVSIAFLLVLLKKKVLILPVIILSILLMQSFQGISNRFAATFTQVDLVVDARTGKAIGIADNYSEGGNVVLKNEESTGENLPQGSKYINLPSGNETGRELVYERQELGQGKNNRIISRSGAVIVKKAFAYDVSFTTRMQGTWPRAWSAFERNYLLGSGYSSISLAADNNYLRILGETGLLGMISFLGIFIFFFIYCIRVLPHVKDNVVRVFTLGVITGVFALMLNAILIDVFEASKVAFVLWLLLGVTLGILAPFQKESIHFIKTLKDLLLSIPALSLYLIIITLFFFYPALQNYFVGDDFSWLRWVSDCQKDLTSGYAVCGSLPKTIQGFFLHADNFFYRPGTKLYFYLMYPVFELFPLPFHLVSLILHMLNGILIFLISKQFFKNKYLAFLTSLIFLTASVHTEAISWISVTGSLISSAFLLTGLLLYIYFTVHQKWWLYVLSFICIICAPFFQEFAIVGPVLLLGYALINKYPVHSQNKSQHYYYWLLLMPIILYGVLRTFARSVWMQGDYAYSLIDLPFNFVGNLFGYLGLSIVGTKFLPFYQELRMWGVSHLIFMVLILLLVMLTGWFILRRILLLAEEKKRLLFLGLFFFIVPLFPFLGLGNIAARYTYLSVFGIAFLITFFIQLTLSSTYLKSQNIKYGIFLLLFFVFSFYNFNQLRMSNKDWQKAGNITNNLIVDLNYLYYQNDLLKRNPTFYFVNVPIKYGDAWVFPVGLEDALWFSLHQSNLRVEKTNSMAEATSQLEKNPKKVKVFEFLPDGSIIKVQKTK